ncbi:MULTISPECIES: siderophore-interacting protein [Roseobacteraceae]|uniref:Vibriobactin utilization protein ViuB n=1 Tax=Pseudosulfitobacter pseudonitzschiae TaxID=1402135 RepID=A0A221K6S1_9RHOB|nr:MULTISPECIES: siderophore-interacting protein [Roseobacteraceae]ASM74676.1 vibriobactin utilization protein ViuB [Pseudosulfitobacter pseudonitzschiae]
MSLQNTLTKTVRPDGQGWLATSDSDAFFDLVMDACKLWELPVAQQSRTHLVVTSDIGEINFARADAGVAISIVSDTDANLFMLRETVAAQIDYFAPTLADCLTWDAAPDTGTMPPNFRLAKVVSLAPLGVHFWRLTVMGDDLGAFSHTGLHLRLALPERGGRAQWPVLNDRGRVRWPDKSALHVAVYTIRSFDPVSGGLVIDVFRHAGGTSSDWLEQAVPGAMVGLMGPGGGWVPDAPHLVIAGDETAIPAIARILDAMPGTTTGTALIEVAETCDYPLPDCPAGMDLHLLSRARGDTLETAMAGVDLGAADHRYVWFAAEKDRATAMRQHLRETQGVGRHESYISAYWQRG